MLESLKQVRVTVEAAVLEEIRLQALAEGEDFPALFCALFEGKDQSDGWFDLFVRDAAAKIKDGSEFEQIWNAEQTALIKAIVAAHSAVLDRIDERTDRTDRRTELMQQDLAELLALARSGGAYQRAAEQGISEAAVRKIVERLGGEGIGLNDLIPWLDNWIDAATRELDRQSDEGEAFEAARREAERRFRAGHLLEASDAFMDELANEDRLEAERQTVRKRHRIRLLEEAIRFDKLALNKQAIISKLRLMANIEGVRSGKAMVGWLLAKAGDFYRQGDDKKSKSDLEVAIDIYRVALEEHPRDREPLEWATTQMKLGNAFLHLGLRGVSSPELNNAIATYRLASEKMPREAVSLNWGGLQNNLGVALTGLAVWESGIARLQNLALVGNGSGDGGQRLREHAAIHLDEAVVAFHDALIAAEKAGSQWLLSVVHVGLARATRLQSASDPWIEDETSHTVCIVEFSSPGAVEV